MVALKTKIKTHKNKFDNILFKIDDSNILECISELASLYSNINLIKKSLLKDGK